MTIIRIYDPKDGPALPELPPLPIGSLAVGTLNLLQEAANLPQPRDITVATTPSSSACNSTQTPPACGPSPAGRCDSAAS